MFDVIDAYEKFHYRLMSELPDVNPPKLLICGHGSIDDPDGALIYDNLVSHVHNNMPWLNDKICIKRLRPLDQILNALLSKAMFVLQLSTREGFEIKISEAIHKGKPVIATRAGGIPIQVEHGKNGFLVDVGDTDGVVDHMFELFTNDELYNRFSTYARNNITDEVSTAANMLNWSYLASKLTKGEEVKPDAQWINDLARNEAGIPYTEDEQRLRRETRVPDQG